MNELIRKQDALDALGEEPLVWYGGEDEIAERNQWRRDVKAIEGVPSAQPEIIRCNACRHWHQNVGDMEGFGLGDCDYLGKKLVTCNGYCYWAERRTDGQTD